MSRIASALSGEQLRRFRDAYYHCFGVLQRGELLDAERQWRLMQSQYPETIGSERVLGLSYLAAGRYADAVTSLRAEVVAAPDSADALAELGHVFRLSGDLNAATHCFREAVARDSQFSLFWQSLGDVLVCSGRFAEANHAFQKSTVTDPFANDMRVGFALLNAGRTEESRSIFQTVLGQNPHQIGALCGLAKISLASGRPEEAERRLRHALKSCRHMPLIRRCLAQSLLDEGSYSQAEAEIRHALLVDELAASGWVILGSILGRTMRSLEALDAYNHALRISPQRISTLIAKGNTLRTLGRRLECEHVYKECLKLQPDCGAAYSGLANLKNYRFTGSEVAAMEKLLLTARAEGGGAPPESDERRVAPLYFALGRAYEQRERDVEAFQHYSGGNEVLSRSHRFDIVGFEELCTRTIATFAAGLFEAHGAAGCPDKAPIFVIGMPRAGSTLIEQILASHSSVDGTMELPHLPQSVREFKRSQGKAGSYPACVEQMSAQTAFGLGMRYIEETRRFRGERSRFVDKMPSNFCHVGFIRLILPNATIIDARRHPMDTCFSAFKQYFPKGQTFTNDLKVLGRYYLGYARLMNHWDSMFPGA